MYMTYDAPPACAVAVKDINLTRHGDDTCQNELFLDGKEGNPLT